jgi:hypothetical protein
MIPDTYKVVYFIEGKYFGSAVRRTEERARRMKLPPESIAWFCTTCGEVWARMVADNAEFRVYSAPCPKHPRFRSIPAGSIWLPWDAQHNEALPPEVIRREFDIHLAHWDYWKGDVL